MPKRNKRRKKRCGPAGALDERCAHEWSVWSEPRGDGSRWHFCKLCKGMETASPECPTPSVEQQQEVKP